MARRKIPTLRDTSDGYAEPVNRAATSEVEGKEADEVYPTQAQVTPEPEQPPTVDDFAEFDIPAEPPKKRGRKKGSVNKRKDTSQTTEFVTSLVDVLGVSLAGAEGALNDTERTLLSLSLDEVGARYSEQVEKYAGYIYPVCGVLAIGLWGKRVLELRANNERQANAETRQQPDPATNTPTVTTPEGTNVYTDPILANGVNRPF